MRVPAATLNGTINGNQWHRLSQACLRPQRLTETYTKVKATSAGHAHSSRAGKPLRTYLFQEVRK